MFLIFYIWKPPSKPFNKSLRPKLIRGKALGERVKLLGYRKFFNRIIELSCWCCVSVIFPIIELTNLDENLHKGLYKIYIRKLIWENDRVSKKMQLNLHKLCLLTANKTNFIAWKKNLLTYILCI